MQVERSVPGRGPRGVWAALPAVPRAVVSGLLVGLIAANVWPGLLVTLGVPAAATVEVVFLAAYLWWAHGGGPPRGTRLARATAFRTAALPRQQLLVGVLAAVCFAAAVHAAIALLFRLVPFPAAAFRQGYDLSFLPSRTLQWIAVVVSAVSAGVCEETGFRGYMQEPIERRHGAMVAILVSSSFFTLVHLTKGWATPGMIPIVFGAGVLLGLLAWSSRSLLPGMIGHTLMDIGLFAYWWSGIAGTFALRPVGQTGVDVSFLATCAVLVATLGVVLVAVRRLERTSTEEP